MDRSKNRENYPGLSGVNPAAYLVTCKGGGSIGKITFAISLRSIKNNDSVCAHCPAHKRCGYARNKHRLHIFATLQNDPSIKLPIPITKIRK